jgi:hypothetical protein
MTPSAFLDKSSEPKDADVAEVLGPARELWDELKRHIAEQHPPIDEAWTFGGKKYGWSLRLKQKKRAVLYMTPLEGCFRVNFALGEKAVVAAHEIDLPDDILRIIDDAPRYAEGRGVRFEVSSAEDVRNAVKVAGVKMEN